MAGIIVHGLSLAAPPELAVVNFQMSGVDRLWNSRRSAAEVTEVVIHETVTQSASAAAAVLRQRGLGVHFIVGYDGTVYQHADLQDDETWHALGHNPASVGIDVVNPFEKQYLPQLNPPWENELEVPWVRSNPYIVPTPEQSEAMCLLLEWLTSPSSGLSIPLRWPGLTGNFLQMGRLPRADMGPGIYAHRYFSEVEDGPWLVLYAWLRLVGGLGPATAYSEALRRAAAVDAVDLSDLISSHLSP